MQPFSHLGRYLKVIDKFVARRRPIAFIQLFDDFDIALREQIKRKFPHRFCFGRRGSHSRREFQYTCSRLSAHAGSPRETQKIPQKRRIFSYRNRNRTEECLRGSFAAEYVLSNTINMHPGWSTIFLEIVETSLRLTQNAITSGSSGRSQASSSSSSSVIRAGKISMGRCFCPFVP